MDTPWTQRLLRRNRDKEKEWEEMPIESGEPVQQQRLPPPPNPQPPIRSQQPPPHSSPEKRSRSAGDEEEATGFAEKGEENKRRKVDGDEEEATGFAEKGEESKRSEIGDAEEKAPEPVVNRRGRSKKQTKPKTSGAKEKAPGGEEGEEKSC